jgi:hypothetical protein
MAGWLIFKDHYPEMTEGLAPDFDADGDGEPDELDRLAISQRLDDLRAVIAELERDLRVGERNPDSVGGRVYRRQ